MTTLTTWRCDYALFMLWFRGLVLYFMRCYDDFAWVLGLHLWPRLGLSMDEWNFWIILPCIGSKSHKMSL